jgi:hypothetical protein
MLEAPSSQQTSGYYQNNARLPLASLVSLRVRRRMYALFADRMRPARESTILDVGVTSDETHPESNYLEQWYPHRDRLTCVGIEDGRGLEQRFPGVTFRQVEAGAPLPFGKCEFDIVFSTAVIEHVGDRGRQQAFIDELIRVGRAFFVTTPNRWFPVEMHTHLPLLHYLPARLHRQVLKALGLGFWASEDNLNLLDQDSFRRLFPASAVLAGVKVMGLTSNWIAHGSVAA